MFIQAVFLSFFFPDQNGPVYFNWGFFWRFFFPTGTYTSAARRHGGTGAMHEHTCVRSENQRMDHHHSVCDRGGVWSAEGRAGQRSAVSETNQIIPAQASNLLLSGPASSPGWQYRGPHAAELTLVIVWLRDLCIMCHNMCTSLRREGKKKKKKPCAYVWVCSCGFLSGNEVGCLQLESLMKVIKSQVGGCDLFRQEGRLDPLPITPSKVVSQS